MATTQELETALINADKAGDTEAAKTLAQALIQARQAQSRAQMTHAAPPTKPKDMYYRQAQDQSFLENLAAGAGGAAYGMFNLGPRSIVGATQPGEVADWKASMSGLGSTGGGTVGQVLGYSAPGALAAPFLGASVPMAAGLGAAEGSIMPAETMGERVFNTLTSAGGATLGQAGGNAVARRMTERAAKTTKEMATKKSQNTVRDATLGMAKGQGYVIPPSYQGSGLFSRFMEGISGKYKTNQLAGIKNQEVTNRLARQALDLPDDAPLTDSALDAYRFSIAEPYREVANLPKRQSVAAASNYTDWDTPVQAVKGFDPAKALQDLKEARYNAKMYWRGANMGNPEALALARKTDDLADALEAQIEQYAVANGDPDLVNRLVNARMQIAKSYTVEKALNEGTGNVDATKLGKMIEKGDPLSGELEKAGRFGMAFSDVARPPKSGDANPVTVLDFMTGVLSSGAGGAAWGGPGAMLLSMAPAATRIGARYGLLSDMGQSMIRPNYSIGLMNKTLPGLLDNPLSRSLYQGAGVYGYGVQPGLE